MYVKMEKDRNRTVNLDYDVEGAGKKSEGAWSNCTIASLFL